MPSLLVYRLPISLALAAMTVAGVLFGAEARAERPLVLNQPERSVESQRNAENSSRREISPAEEATALAFVKQHHAELAKLLRILRTMNRPQYENAIRDLTRTRLRLEQVRQRSERRYEAELRAWQAKSRIQLLTARLQMSDSPELRAALTAAFERQMKHRHELLLMEQTRLQERLSRIEEQLQRDPSEAAKRAAAEILNRLDAAKRSKNKPSAKSRSSTARSKEKS